MVPSNKGYMYLETHSKESLSEVSKRELPGATVIDTISGDGDSVVGLIETDSTQIPSGLLQSQDVESWGFTRNQQRARQVAEALSNTPRA